MSHYWPERNPFWDTDRENLLRTHFQIISSIALHILCDSECKEIG